MIQAVVKGVGGRVSTEFLDRYPGTTVTVSLYTGEGTARFTDTAGTVDSVNTTLADSVETGDITVTLTSLTGVEVNRRYCIGTGAGTEPQETVSVRYISGSDVTLWGPLVNNHASGSTFHGTRVSCSVSSTDAANIWWDGYAVFTPADGTDPQTEVVDCALRKIPEKACDETDLYKVFPKGAGMLDEELDMPSAIKDARDWFLMDLSGKGGGGRARAMTVLGADHFRRPVAIKFWLQRRASFGEDSAIKLDELQKEYDNIIDRILSLIPVDGDQDGSTTGINDGNFTVGKIERR